MAFWVKGRDAVTGARGTMLSTGSTIDEARQQALDQGLIADTFEPAESFDDPPPPKRIRTTSESRARSLRLWIPGYTFLLGGIVSRIVFARLPLGDEFSRFIHGARLQIIFFGSGLLILLVGMLRQGDADDPVQPGPLVWWCLLVVFAAFIFLSSGYK